MTDRLITADARRVTGAEFFRGVFGQSREDREFKQARHAAWLRIHDDEWAKYRALYAAGCPEGEKLDDWVRRMWIEIDATSARVNARLAAWEANYRREIKRAA
jgi:hypothetical protein